jgi:tetratricopeptide (TPR) repeat protein
MISAGWAFMRAGNSRGALREFKSALAIDPEDREALSGLCQSYLDIGDLSAAEEQADALLRLAPELASAHRLKAEVLRRRRSRHKARGFAEQAVKLEPSEPVGYHILAVIHEDLKDYRKALKVVAEGRANAPWYGVLAAQQATIVLQLKGSRAAEPIAREALGLAMEDSYVLTSVARIFLMRGQLEEARDLLVSVLHRNANHETAISLYLLTDRRRYRILRAGIQFPVWRKDHGAMGWAAWLSAWSLALMVAVLVVAGTHVPGIVVALAYRGFWQVQYNRHRGEVRKHFSQPALRAGY